MNASTAFALAKTIHVKRSTFAIASSSG